MRVLDPQPVVGAWCHACVDALFELIRGGGQKVTVTRRARGDGFNTEIAEIAEIVYLSDLGDLCVESRLRVLFLPLGSERHQAQDGRGARRRQLIAPTLDIREADRSDVCREEVVRRVGRGMPRREHVAPEDRAWIVIGDRAVARLSSKMSGRSDTTRQGNRWAYSSQTTWTVTCFNLFHAVADAPPRALVAMVRDRRSRPDRPRRRGSCQRARLRLRQLLQNRDPAGASIRGRPGRVSRWGPCRSFERSVPPFPIAADSASPS